MPTASVTYERNGQTTAETPLAALAQMSHERWPSDPLVARRRVCAKWSTDSARPRMNILWLKTELLHPLDEDVRMRSYHILRELNREHAVIYLTLDDGHAAAEAAARATEYCTELVRVPMRPPAKRSLASYRDLARSFSSSLPYAVGKYRSAAMQQKIAEIVRDKSIDVAVCDSLVATVNVPTALPVPTILFQHKVEAIGCHRPASASDPFRKRYFQQQGYRMYAFERSQCRRFDHVIAVSPEDFAWFTVDYGVQHASYIPGGVDTTFFRPASAARAEPRHLVFTGSMDRISNEDAASYFMTAILPRVRDVASDVKLTIIGRDPTPRVQTLARLHSCVHVTGTVADIRPYLERATVVVVPLRIGGGTRSEIFEAMAMEKPIVSTTVGVDGLPVSDNEHLLIADTAEQLASAVTRLLDNPVFAKELGRRAASLVRSKFAWSQVATRFADACDQVIAAHSNALQGHEQ